MRSLIAITMTLVTIYGISARCAETDFELPDLLKLAQQPQIKSVDDLVKTLPAQMRKNFTLIHSSKSLQGSSYEAPRAILTNSTGKLVVTFNGSPNDRGYDSVEVASYDSGRERIQFTEISFVQDKANAKSNFKMPLAPSDIAVHNDIVEISKPNPMKCLTCHSADTNTTGLPNDQRIARYIWAPYRTWVTAYGASDDYVWSDKYSDAKEESEIAKLKLFRSSATNQERYKHLIFGKSKNAPYCDETYLNTYDFRCRKNSLLTSAIGYNQLDQLANITVAKYETGEVISFLLEDLACPAPKTLKLRTSLIKEIFSRIQPLSDPGAHLKETFRSDEGQWNTGDEQQLHRGVNLRDHFAAALIRELSKKSQSIAQMYSRAKAGTYPPSAVASAKQIYFNDFYIQKQMDHFLAITDDIAQSLSPLEVKTLICKTLKEELLKLSN